MPELSDFIHQLLQTPPEMLTWDFLKQTKRKYARHHGLSTVPSNIQLLNSYNTMIRQGEVVANKAVETVLKKRPIRSQSGIVSVQVLTKPFWCPGKCIFCPNDFTMPKSYINTEPGAMRALLNGFDPVKQVYNRLLSLTATGHATDKIEMIVLGGTRDVYPHDYKESFIKGLYDACNTFQQFYANVKLDPSNPKSSKFIIEDNHFPVPATLAESITINTTSANRIIGLTIETRPEYVTDENCRFWRELSVTRLEVGLQNLFDDVLEANKRGHTVQQAREAVHKLRQYGFKVSLHMMPGLYMSSYEKDLESFQRLYDDPFFKPDEIKFYPTSVIPNTELYELYLAGKYEPMGTEAIQQLIRETFLRIIPPYTRIKRLIRDIPATEIIAGSNITNLSQLTHQQLQKEWKNSPEAKSLYARLRPNVTHVMGLAEVPNEAKDLQTRVLGGTPDLESRREFVSLDSRSREIRHKQNGEGRMKNEKSLLVVRIYESSVGTECFIAFEDALGYLYGFTRLLLPKAGETVAREGLGSGTALIRELHVYGQMAELRMKNGEGRMKDGEKTQHKGLGTQLMEAAETLAKNAGYEKLSVISGVGVRGYYEKLGYGLEGTYMVKSLKLKD